MFDSVFKIFPSIHFINVYANIFNFDLASISTLETKVDNIGDSFDYFCNQLESGSGQSAVHCCSNENTLKIVCATKALIDLSSSLTIGVLTSVGVCDFSLSGNSCA